MFFFASALWLLAQGHPHEDAYILFHYVRNLATGQGIVFDGTSGPAEGATDFLWMVVLSGLYALGLTPAVGAAFLNAFGLGGVAYLLLSLNVSRLELSTVVVLVLLALSGGVAASLCGFSTLAYGCVILLFLLAIRNNNPARAVFAGLILGLFRPDGVILAAGGLLAYVLQTPSKQRRMFTVPFFMAMLIGGVYFLWRYSYFGFLLPLPLIVKSHPSTWYEGLIQNIRAINVYVFLLFPLMIPVVRAKLWESPDDRRTIIAALSASFALFLALLFAHQSQNIAGRFQFPIILSLMMIYGLASSHLPRDRMLRAIMIGLLPVLILAQNASLISQCARTMMRTDSINIFPQMLRAEGIDQIGIRRIAITEAGRFPYWVNAPTMVDLVGLNSPQRVEDTAGTVLEKTRPDLIFVHHAGRYDVSAFDHTKDYIVFSADGINLLPSASTNPVDTAPEAALIYARSQNGIAVFVKYFGKFSHVYFLLPAVNQQRFLSILDQSLSAHLSYLESEQQITFPRSGTKTLE